MGEAEPPPGGKRREVDDFSRLPPPPSGSPSLDVYLSPSPCRKNQAAAPTAGGAPTKKPPQSKSGPQEEEGGERRLLFTLFSNQPFYSLLCAVGKFVWMARRREEGWRGKGRRRGEVRRRRWRRKWREKLCLSRTRDDRHVAQEETRGGGKSLNSPREAKHCLKVWRYVKTRTSFGPFLLIKEAVQLGQITVDGTVDGTLMALLFLRFHLSPALLSFFRLISPPIHGGKEATRERERRKESSRN